eukprot:CAMPEP_0206144530 /NCGR_PEP_ID=MMETSP1473-20131121/24410_1 /ASSEMBLY_ACC=CAM_ASM_001109 /TAXON_ID=1461547 /ORGANISM="Stichococcus sp, Strain RCC1054" /LENGTH=61 /DNA_ID=CAMNT_0053540371 /DNA_START=100 /DNA_END=281 /DNA_ORIENTATION=-
MALAAVRLRGRRVVRILAMKVREGFDALASGAGLAGILRRHILPLDSKSVRGDLSPQTGWA